jgi:uncharacterized protein (DUF58 family)
MLPRARTAAPGSLSEDPVVPLVPRRRVLGLPFGDARSVRRGGHADPVGSRLYQPGDDLRLIDRHATARLSSVGDGDVLIVREHLAEERVGVGLIVDPSPTMALHPEGLPWLRKPAVVAEVDRVITASARRKRSELVRLEEFPPGRPPRRLGAGSIVFLLSDFLVFPAEEAWADAAARSWDVVPVVVQDPLWERSFPDIAGVTVPLADLDGKVRPVRLSAAEASARRTANETRFAEIVAQLEDLGLDPVVLDTADPDAVFDALLLWADARQNGLAWTA